ncbi:MAG: PEGA domain-containing protein [candidate division KSB1 bacterium]|nr:PEGA domain-containing protein [candidate division KSB1 bacterium]MDZ7272924.1 PEGA domain-containing protein [candidate division KSB1 bacterium]MDZ7284054.1 PEGA domain-containing protein [candidate division KSB1 bacterium]MDZ7297549.1 PEGA domain-containing protein [candidate division KSB1 bacterium]MDZ7308930.1 PEGA domain-containing protein [candidate division KSB1 bacterium]
MPAPSRYAFHAVTAWFATSLVALLWSAGLLGCASGRLTTDRAYARLKPKQQLPERELREQPENLLIKITNVADAGRSYRNFVVLRINGQEISPIEKLSNFTSTYTYPLRLQHGIYEVKAEYHVVGFWREQVFDIVTDEEVKVLPGQRTVLQVALDKDSRGWLRQNPARFQLRYEPLLADKKPVEEKASSGQAAVTTPRPFIIEPAPEKPDPRPIITRPAPEVIAPAPSQPVAQAPQATPAASQPAPADVVTVQINTSPAGAEVIVDDRYYGQSPLKITLTNTQNHILQISRPGYREVVKILNAAELREQPLLQLLIKMEPVEKTRE